MSCRATLDPLHKSMTGVIELKRTERERRVRKREREKGANFM